ncbi:MAG: efflux RND transporter periplasmic adaptor subunit [Rhodospirillaceae bacterium]
MMRKNPFSLLSMAIFAALFVVTVSSVQAEDKALSDRAKAADKNNNGLIERNEAGGPLAANFDEMDCDKNGGLDGAEIRGFFTGAGCPDSAPKAAAAPAASKYPPLSDRAKGLDANNNGLVDRDEARGPLQANFDDMDCDKNGGLDGAEIPAFFQGKSCADLKPKAAAAAPAASKYPPLNERAKGLDSNNNGLVDRDEARGPLQANFDDMDCDKNGGLDGAEIPAFFQGKSCVDLKPKTASAAPAAKPAAEGRPAGRRAGGRPPQSVQLGDALVEAITDTYRVVGRAVALQRGPVAARVSGAIDAINVGVGARVAKGDVLVSLAKSKLEAERRRIAAQVARQQTNMRNAERELQRIKNLQKSAAFSRARFEDLEGQVAERRAQLAEVRAALNSILIDIANTSIKAPYDAVVVDKHVEVGGFVNVGAPVVTLLNEKALEVEADVASTRVSGLTIWSSASVISENGDKFPATVKTIIPDENTRTRTRPVRLTVDFGADGGEFAHNQSVSVELPIASDKKIVTVHKDAVVSRANGSVVFVVTGTSAAMRTVRIGRGIGNKFEILEGLKGGEKVVVRGNERLGAGGTVKVIN